CASSDEEKAYMKKVPYASAVGSIMYVVKCTRPDVAFAQNMIPRNRGVTADAFTKALPREKVNEHANGIGLRLVSSFMHICD
nr:retrovirus-related Pol polyprotein from transposon TNT 1-94 [Tanacetum cinerariifolium]